MNTFQIRKSNFKLVVANTGIDEVQLLEFFDSATVHTYKNFGVLEEIGTTGSGDDNFDTPIGVSISPDLNKIAVCDYANSRIVIRTFPGLVYIDEISIGNPYGVFFTDNYLYAVEHDLGDSHIRKYSLTDYSLVASSTGYADFGDIVIDSDETYLYTTSSTQCLLRKHLVSDFSVSASIGSSGSGSDQFSSPYGICIDPAGTYIFVADSGNDRIVKRLASTLAFVDETSGLSLDTPFNICISPDGRYLFLTDVNNSRIVVISAIDLSLVSEYSTGLTTPYGITITGWGENRVQTISEPATDYFYNKLLKYLPEFITENDLLEAVLKGFQAVLLVAKKYINASTEYALANYKYQGVGLAQTAKELFLFLSGEEGERETQWYIENHETIHQQRGSLLGLRNDLYRATRDQYLTVEEVEADECGWWLDVTFPQISPAGTVEKSATSSFIDCENQINVNVADNTGAYTEPQLNEIVSKYFIPAHAVCNMVYKYIPTWYVPIDTTDDLDMTVEVR